MKQTERIFDIVKQVFQLSKGENIPTNSASDKITEQRLNSISRIRNIYPGVSSYSVDWMN